MYLTTRKKLERRLKSIDIDKIRDEFHDLEDNKLENLTAIILANPLVTISVMLSLTMDKVYCITGKSKR